MRHNAPLVLLLALLFALAACTGQAAQEEAPDAQAPVQADDSTSEPTGVETEDGAPFTLGYYADLGLNPYTCSNSTNQAVIRLLYEPLFEVGPDFSVQPVLAVSCRSDGGGRWTLTLAEDAVFWNGEALTAQDVVYSLEQAAAEESIYAARLAPMSELSAEGDAVAFSWSEPLGELESLLEIPIVQAGTAADSIPTGTGPYQPVSGEDGLASLSIHRAWSQAESLPVEEIALYPVTDSDMLIYGFESGEITLVPSDLTGSNSLGYSGNYEVWDYPTSYLLYLGCNTADGPCAETAFRLALQDALDREMMATSLLSGHAAASPLPFHPDSALYDAALADAFSEPDSSALEGYAGESVTILVNADSSFKITLAESIAAVLEAAGLEAEVETLAWSDYQTSLEAGAYDLYLGEVRLEPNFDLSALLAEDGSLNFSGYRSDGISAALDAYRAASSDTRAEAAAALSAAVCQEAPILPLCFEEHSILSSWGSLAYCTATQSNLFYHIQDWTLSG